MRLIETFRIDEPGLDQRFEGLCSRAIDFFERRTDLHSEGASFGSLASHPGKVSTDLSLVWLDRSDPEAHALSDTIMLAVASCLKRFLKARPLLMEVCPERSLFITPIFNLQRYRPGEGFRAWHCDWTTADDATDPIRRVLAWILYLNTVPDAGTEFHWQEHHVEAIEGRMAIFPAGLSHVHRGRVSEEHTKYIATGWINAGSLDAYVRGLAG
jgi:hypothetical protein